ncbi:serine/threonine protein kinase [Calothrix sp. NIES-4101]|nr:serine/threonine protein kinase [Calothrix sp. NIES-4101]
MYHFEEYTLTGVPQIPKLSEHFQENSEFYLVQEFIDGKDLSYEIIPGEKLSEADTIQLLQEILEVLAVIHQNNVIHRDIKPANIMRRSDGKIILIDFGAVKEIKSLSMSQGQVTSTIAIGTPGYMPSEQALGQPKLCSDVYAVGILGIYALTGIQPHQLPKDPKNDEIIWRNWGNVSEKTAKVLDGMVRYRSGERYPTATQALEAVAGLRAKPKVKTQQTFTQPGTDISRRQTLKTLGWVGAGFGLAVVAGRISMWDTQKGNSGILGKSDSSSTTPSNLSLQSFSFKTVTVDAKGNITNPRNLQARYLAEDLGNGVILEMVQIPGGTFTMGSPESEAERSTNESPQRQVTVPGFFMGRYVVTQAQYQAIMGNNPARFKGANKPVENVYWDDAVEFCQKLSQKTGRTYRLPSEAEWEYACRAGTTTPFYFGETITTDLANYNGTATPYGSAPQGVYRKETTEVGQFPPNAFGLYDMHGNVWEWCEDVWNDNYNQAPTDGSARLSGNDNQRKVLRGGSWFYEPSLCRSASRYSFNRAERANILYDVGFRMVVVLA